MNTHMKTGTIPDPSYYPEAALKVLRGHFECMEHAARFIELSNDPNADAEIMTGSNLKQILNLLPLRFRQEDDSLNTAETNVSRRKDQYLKIKDWVGKMQQKLILRGTKQNEKSETKVAMVTVSEPQQGRTQQNNTGDTQRKGARNQRQDTRNGRNRNSTDRNLVTECGFCNLIQGKDVSQEYVAMDFDERHQEVGDRPIYPNTCLPWMMLSMEEREKVLENNELYCKMCLRSLKRGRGGSACGPGRHTINTGHNGMCSKRDCEIYVTMCKRH